MSSSQKGHIFISYRRADSEGYAGRIYDRITPHFGADAVFMDVDTIDAGVDFVKVLEDAVQSCDVLVALIGRRWLNLKDVDGTRRLDNPEDFVRVEIATALNRDIRVIPVLVGGAIMPESAELPENLKSLARRNALTVNHATFHADMSRLIEHLERALQAAEDSKILKAKKIQEEQARKARQAQVEKLLHQADTAINLSDWKLAGEKLKEILALDPGHLKAQAKLELVEDKERIERSEREEARKRKKKQEQEAAAKAQAERQAREKAKAEDRTRQAALRMERQREIVERAKTFLAGMGKLPLYISGGIALLFIFGYIISNIELPVKSEPTKTPAASIPATGTTEVSSTLTPEFSVGSTMVSEKDGMVMVYVLAGEFQMGNENGEDDEKPVHTVYLDAFWIDQTEVTNEMFAAFLNVEGNQSEGDVTWLDADDEHVRIHKVGDTWQVDSGYGDHPVVEVSWYGAKAYCEWTDRRLPTEAEWEKAAGWDADAGAQRTYPWGELIDGSYANYNQNVEDTTPVGSYDKGTSFYRAYDMAGNVWEWVADWYGRDYYKKSTGNNPTGPSSGNHRVLRGGSWFYGDSNNRSANRNLLNDPSIPTISSSDIGFRCSLSAATPEPDSTSLPESTLNSQENLTADIGSKEHPIKVLFAPSRDVDFMTESSDLIAQSLSDATGYSFEVSVPTSYAATIEEMCAFSDNTIGFIPAIDYVLANQLCGVKPGLAGESFGYNVYWTGFYVARKSNFQSLEDLAGADWAYPDARSTSGYLIHHLFSPNWESKLVKPSKLEVTHKQCLQCITVKPTLVPHSSAHRWYLKFPGQ